MFTCSIQKNDVPVLGNIFHVKYNYQFGNNMPVVGNVQFFDQKEADTFLNKTKVDYLVTAFEKYIVTIELARNEDKYYHTEKKNDAYNTCKMAVQIFNRDMQLDKLLILSDLLIPSLEKVLPSEANKYYTKAYNLFREIKGFCKLHLSIKQCITV